jgi:thiamine-phosphate pyrophosphorylase
MKLNKNQRFMFITHRTVDYTEVDEIRMLLEGGCSWIQLRMKNTLNLAVAREAVALCQAYNAETICCLNDDVEMALACGASGVHIGKNDMPLSQAWELVEKQGRKESFIIGVTANTFEDIQQAVAGNASYIGLGPYRQTTTKEKLSPLLGLEGYKKIMQQYKDARLDIPIFAIGGIEFDDIPSLMQTGISGVAVSGAIIRANDPTTETRKFLNIITENE